MMLLPPSFVLIAQDVLKLSPLQTAIRLIPIGVVGFVVSIGTGRLVEHLATRTILLSGLVISIISVVPAATIPNGNNGGFWTTVFPTSVVAVIGISVVYNVLSIALRMYLRFAC
jgi:predicted MFS family arabinose efflux permease